jgi:hypothetical protein
MQRSAAQSIPTYAAMDIYYKQHNDGSHTETRSPTQWRLMETEKGRRAGKVKEGEAKGTVQQEGNQGVHLIKETWVKRSHNEM